MELINKVLLHFYNKVFIKVISLFYFPLSLVLFFFKIRLIIIDWNNAIGHIVGEPDMFLREEYLGKLEKKKNFLLINEKEIANKHYINYLKNDFIIIKNVYLYYLLKPFKFYNFISIDVKKYFTNINCEDSGKFKEAINNFDYYKIFNKTSSQFLLHLNQEDENYSKKIFSELGLDRYPWFVTLHYREHSYRDKKSSPRDTNNFDNYIKAVKLIISHGGAVVRVGRGKKMDKTPMIEGLIDYSNSDFTSDRNDIILCAKSKFFIGSNSGLCWIPFKFNVNTVFLNYAPFAKRPLPENSIYIPKLVCDQNDNFLKFKDILNSDYSNSILDSRYEENNVYLKENSEEDIYNTILEFIKIINNNYVQNNDEKKLINKFENIRLNSKYPYIYGANISGSFLKKYQNLF